MFWKVTCEDTALVPSEAPADGRFVIHRHIDADGSHLDLRIEMNECLMGWRVDAPTLDGEPWATEKRPHPLHWLDQAGDAVHEESGVYTWESRRDDEVCLILRGSRGVRRVRLARAPGLPPAAARSICDSLAAAKVTPKDAARLITDGVTARRRAVERLCGLARELDGSVFDEAVWRRTLDGLTLDEIHAQLRAYEVRFDKTYPPLPVSQPEPLPAWKPDGRSGAAMAILRDEARPGPSAQVSNRAQND